MGEDPIDVIEIKEDPIKVIEIKEDPIDVIEIKEDPIDVIEIKEVKTEIIEIKEDPIKVIEIKEDPCIKTHQVITNLSVTTGEELSTEKTVEPMALTTKKSKKSVVTVDTVEPEEEPKPQANLSNVTSTEELEKVQIQPVITPAEEEPTKKKIEIFRNLQKVDVHVEAETKEKAEAEPSLISSVKEREISKPTDKDVVAGDKPTSVEENVIKVVKPEGKEKVKTKSSKKAADVSKKVDKKKKVKREKSKVKADLKPKQEVKVVKDKRSKPVVKNTAEKEIPLVEKIAAGSVQKVVMETDGLKQADEEKPVVECSQNIIVKNPQEQPKEKVESVVLKLDSEESYGSITSPVPVEILPVKKVDVGTYDSPKVKEKHHVEREPEECTKMDSAESMTNLKQEKVKDKKTNKEIELEVEKEMKNIVNLQGNSPVRVKTKTRQQEEQTDEPETPAEVVLKLQEPVVQIDEPETPAEAVLKPQEPVVQIDESETPAEAVLKLQEPVAQIDESETPAEVV